MKGKMVKGIFFANHFLAVCFMARLAAGCDPGAIQNTVPLVLTVLFLGDIVYIVSSSVKESRILYLFCGLLAVDGWYLMLSVNPVSISDRLFRLLGPAALYLSVRFCLLFLFQGYKYRFKKAADIFLILAFLTSAAGVFLGEWIYACAYGIQFAGSVLCFLYIAALHWKRVSYVLRKERKPVLLSLSVTILLFLIYYTATANVKDHIENFGIYIVALIFSMSVHGIVMKETNGLPISAIITWKQQLFICGASAALAAGLCIAAGWTFAGFLAVINFFLAAVFLLNLILGENLKRESGVISRESKYAYAVSRLRHEEKLKKEFAGFLHDEVLQDLLAVKNMAGKSDRSEVRELITRTLEGLNIRIRNQMQDYHPVISKSLTLKENLDQLIESISAVFAQREISVTLECPDTIFIPEPYDVLVYRLIKELVTNVYKHSDGDRAWVTLYVENDTLHLCVRDNGKNTAARPGKEDNGIWHKGLLSVREQITELGGTMSAADNLPEGTRTEISFLMRGEDSYQHFVS